MQEFHHCMKHGFLMLCLTIIFSCLIVNTNASPSLQQLLDAQMAPPPRHQNRAITEIQQAATAAATASEPSSILLDVASHSSSMMSAEDQAALAVDEGVLEVATVEHHMSAAGRLTAEEQELISRRIPIPNTYIPSDPPKKINYLAPPTNDKLKIKGRYQYPEKLQNALNTIVSAANSKKYQMKRQKKWTQDATKLVKELGLKRTKVNQHVGKLSREIRKLLGKKKQIQNKKTSR